jgi:hypothetical protein
MDALLARSGIFDAKTDITKAEIYVHAKGDAPFEEEEIRALIEDDYGYGLRSYAIGDQQWDTYAKRED